MWQRLLDDTALAWAVISTVDLRLQIARLAAVGPRNCLL
jgi:hypothetical protein